MSANKTITSAIIDVLKKEGKALSIKDIHNRIVAAGLYQFNTANAEHVVRSQLRRHAENIQLKTASTTKHFVANSDGTYDLKK
jgi:hypothetical protein